MHIENRDGKQLDASLDKPEGASKVVVMCHGFSTSKDTGSNILLRDFLSEMGIASLRYSAHGHGDSYGDFRDVTISQAARDLIDVLRYAKKLDWVKEVAVYGSSFGGITAVLGVASEGGVNSLGLKAPAVNWKNGWDRKLGDKEMEEWKKTDKHDYREGYVLGYGIYEDLKRINAYVAAEKIECPTLILQGDKDTSVLLKDNEKLASIIPNCRLVIKAGEGHHFESTKEEVMKELAEFFRKNF